MFSVVPTTRNSSTTHRSCRTTREKWTVTWLRSCAVTCLTVVAVRSRRILNSLLMLTLTMSTFMIRIMIQWDIEARLQCHFSLLKADHWFGVNGMISNPDKYQAIMLGPPLFFFFFSAIFVCWFGVHNTTSQQYHVTFLAARCRGHTLEPKARISNAKKVTPETFWPHLKIGDVF